MIYCTRRSVIFVLYFSKICVKIENDRLVGTWQPVYIQYGLRVL